MQRKLSVLQHTNVWQMFWRSALALIMTASTLLGALAVSPAQAAGGPPSAIFDPETVAWASLRNMTSAQFSADFQARSDAGYMVIDIEVEEINGTQRVGAVWQKNTDNRGWYEWRNLTSSEFSQKWNLHKSQGYRLIDQESYVLDGTRYYAGVWIENKENLAWASWRNLTSSEFSDKFQQYKDAGYIPVDVEGYPTGAGLRYAIIWVKNTENLNWVEWRDLTSSEFSEKFQAYKDGYRMVDVESYRSGGKQYYAGIWVENKNGRGWAEWRDMTSTDFSNKWQQYRDAGYRLTDYEVYPTGNGWRYAGIWRQNSDRPDWPLKSQVDSYFENQSDTFDIPGMSVAIAHKGQIVYLRGFGHADVDANKVANSRTVYRLASVSKALAGLISVRMAQQGQINLNAASSTYINGLPAHHTHTVAQTLSNRSGIGHYEDHGFFNGQYNSSLAALQTYWNDPLVYGPGAGYKYSTHGFNAAAAAAEGVTGDSVSEVINDWLSSPFNLPTIQAENRSVPNWYRSTLYNTDNSEATPDNISGKVWGGGMEGSAYDLVRMGIKLLNGQILSAASRTLMWTPPDGQSNFALGWNTNTDQGTPVVAKNGGQIGANSYTRIYPDKDIVIVVLSNRWQGNHSTTQMGRDIGTMMLDNEELLTQSMAPILTKLPISVLPILQQTKDSVPDDDSKRIILAISDELLMEPQNEAAGESTDGVQAPDEISKDSLIDDVLAPMENEQTLITEISKLPVEEPQEEAAPEQEESPQEEAAPEQANLQIFLPQIQR